MIRFPWLLPLTAVLIGTAIGIGAFTFGYAEGYSYLSNDPAACARPAVATARAYQRWAQFFTDFVEAENSMGFHADQEAVRILGKAINYARIGQRALTGEPVPPPSADVAAASPARPPQSVTPVQSNGGQAE